MVKIDNIALLERRGIICHEHHISLIKTIILRYNINPVDVDETSYIWTIEDTSQRMASPSTNEEINKLALQYINNQLSTEMETSKNHTSKNNFTNDNTSINETH